MAGLLDQLSDMLTPENVNALSGAIGVDPATLQQGMNVAGPLLQGGLADTVSSPGGLDSLTSLLGSIGGGQAAGVTDPITSLMGALGSGTSGVDSGGGPGSLMGAFGPPLGGALGGASGADASAGGNDMVSSIVNMALGDGNSAIAKYIDKMLGFKISPILALASPLLIGLLKRDASSRGLDSAGIADYLRVNNEQFVTSGNPAAQLVADAREIGKAAVAVKNRFDKEQWAQVRSSPLAAAAAVIFASPSGMGGAAREVGSALAAIAEHAEKAAATSMLTTAFSSGLNVDSFSQFTANTSRSSILQTIASAASAVDMLNADEAQDFKSMIMDVAQKTAEASKEGGFLGFGGTKISDAEAAVLEEIRRTLAL